MATLCKVDLEVSQSMDFVTRDCEVEKKRIDEFEDSGNFEGLIHEIHPFYTAIFYN